MAECSFDFTKIKNITKGAEKKLLAIGFQMEKEIKMSMKAGSGRMYGKHRASAPGEPPAVDTGRLRGSISTNWSGSGMAKGSTEGVARGEDGVGQPDAKEDMFTVVVGTNVPYASFLEFGTRNMAPRPFMRPIQDKFKSKYGMR